MIVSADKRTRGSFIFGIGTEKYWLLRILKSPGGSAGGKQRADLELLGLGKQNEKIYAKGILPDARSG